jgi:exo-beta-1,3-glucanase (GH17 family)
MTQLNYGKAICYSGYREGQSPITKVYPSYDQIKQDLLILDNQYDYIRMYDPSEHAQTVLKVIKENKLHLKVVLGIDLAGEVSNPNCSWGGILTEEQIERNIIYNENQLRKLINLANEYKDIIVAVSAGNEAVPEWNENLVRPERVLYFVKELKKNTIQLVTYCENVHYWIPMLKDVVEEVDFISIHTYPAWVNVNIEDALNASIKDYQKIKEHYKDKPCIITEAGWPTKSSGRGILVEAANEVNQEKYVNELVKWSEENQVVTFIFEAFDEPWKGDDKEDEPEKHWGLYSVDRQPKKIMKA